MTIATQCEKTTETNALGPSVASGPTASQRGAARRGNCGEFPLGLPNDALIFASPSPRRVVLFLLLRSGADGLDTASLPSSHQRGQTKQKSDAPLFTERLSSCSLKGNVEKLHSVFILKSLGSCILTRETSCVH